MNECIQACKRTSMAVRMNGRMGNIDGRGIDGMGKGELRNWGRGRGKGEEQKGIKKIGKRGERRKRREGGREALHLFSNFLFLLKDTASNFLSPFQRFLRGKYEKRIVFSFVNLLYSVINSWKKSYGNYSLIGNSIRECCKPGCFTNTFICH